MTEVNSLLIRDLDTRMRQMTSVNHFRRSCTYF